VLVIDIRKLLPVVVADDETRGCFFNGPRREAASGQAVMTLRTVAKNRSTRSTLRNWGDLIGDRPMDANPDEPRPRPFTEWVASEPLALMFGIVAIPMIAIAFGVCIAILANAFR